MIFAIDYDGTFSRDPEFWRCFVSMAKVWNHQCVLVTARTDDVMGDEVRKNVDGIMPIVFAGLEWKREAALKRGWKVDVWIDDAPEYVGKQMIFETR